MKICVFTANEFMNHKTFREMSEFWKKWGHEVDQYNLADYPNEDYLFKIRHYQMYEGFLNYAEKTNPDLVWFDNLLTVPEYLLAELEVRPDFKPKIEFMFSFRESYKSKARANVLRTLIEKSQIKFIILESFIGKDIIPPTNWIKLGQEELIKTGMEKTWRKMKIIYDRVNEEPSELKRDKKISRQKYGLPLDKFIILYFGRMTHSKGIDLLVKAMDQLDNDYLLFVKSKPVYLDFDFNVEKELKGKKNIIFLEEHTEQKDLGYVFSACDISAIPYRWTYTYGSSGIPMQAAMAHRPILSPSFYPFNYFMRKFKLGTMCELENIDSLVEAIKEAKNNYDKIIKNAKFDEYVKCCTTMEQMAKVVVEDI